MQVLPMEMLLASQSVWNRFQASPRPGCIDHGVMTGERSIQARGAH